jgi:murein lipoprotein
MKKSYPCPVPVKSLGAVAILALLGGCATTAQEKELRAELDEVRAIAEQAAADAAAARASADAAMLEAETARAQSADTEAKIDRMFKKAMYK